MKVIPNIQQGVLSIFADSLARLYPIYVVPSRLRQWELSLAYFPNY